jgi:hypothetical protein
MASPSAEQLPYFGPLLDHTEDAIMAFVVVPEHAPQFVCGGFGEVTGNQCAGWSRTAYDAARIATWALAIVGVLLVVMGMIRYARPQVQR